MKPLVEIYTDGSCKGNPGQGSYGYIVYVNQQHVHTFVLAVEHTTNNIMELLALLEALKYIDKNHIEVANIYTDSKYVRDGVTNWMHNWIKKEWITSNNTAVLNQEIWKEIYNLYDQNRVKMFWIKAHTGLDDKHSFRNNIIDKLVSNQCHKTESNC